MNKEKCKILNIDRTKLSTGAIITKYKWTIHYHIEKQNSCIIEEARDKTYNKWLIDKESGNQALTPKIIVII